MKVVALCALAAIPISTQAAVRVALMDFTSEDSAYRAEIAAQELTTALYGQLPRNEAVEWVERQQLDVAAAELKLSPLERRSDSAAVHVGKWLKADLLLLGHVLSGEKAPAGVRLEVINLEQADVLAERVVALGDNLKRTNLSLAGQTMLVMEEVIPLIRQALDERERRKRQVAVGVLFFHRAASRWTEAFWDAGKTHTLASLPLALDKAFERTIATNQLLRLVRFPRPNRALEEAELVLSGLVESDPQAWLKVADYFVWGEITSTNVWLNQGTARRQQTSLEIAVHVWDGRSEPKTFREGPIVLAAGGLPEGEVTARCAKLAQQAVPAKKSGAAIPSEAVRQRVSRILEKRADDVFGDGFFAVFDSLENRARIGNLLQSLELACFFDPQNHSAQLKLVSRRWGNPVEEYAKDKFRFAWRASDAWGSYVEKFGFELPAGEKNPWLLVGSEIADAYVHSTIRVASKFLYWNTVPEDVPTDVLEGWQSQIAAEFVKRVIAVTNRPEMLHSWPGVLQDGLDYGARLVVPDAKLRAKLIETVWPRYVESAMQTHRTPGLEEIRGGISRTFAEVGRTGEEQKLFAMLGPLQEPAAPPAVTRQAWLERLKDSPKFTVPRIAALPPKFDVQPEKLNLPLGASRDAQYGFMPIHSLLYHRGKLWIAATVEEQAVLSQVNPDLARDLTPARGKANRLWRYDPDTKQVHAAPGGLASSGAMGLSGADGQLWIAGEGLVRLELTSEKVRRFGVADGLPVRDTEAVRLVGDRLFVAGGRFELFVQDSQSERWSPVVLPVARWAKGTGQPMNMLATQGKLLFLAGSVGLYDPTSGRWKLFPELTNLQSCDADDAGFWFGGRDGLYFLDARTEKLLAWKSESGLSWPTTTYVIAPAPSMSPPDAARSANNPAWAHEEIVKAFQKFAADRKAAHARREQAHIIGETAPPKTRLRGDITAMACDGDFLWLGCRDYYSYVLLLHKPSHSWVGQFIVSADVTSLAASDRHLWIGLSGGEDRLLQVNKAGLLATPRSRWVKDEIGSEEFAATVTTMPKHDQALHTFFAGDYASAARLLERETPQSRSLETLFLLAFSYDNLGLDRPDDSRRYFAEIIERYPNSPWADVATEAMKEDTFRHQEKRVRSLQLAKFDRNHNGVLDDLEKRALAADPTYAQEAAKLADQQTAMEMEQIVKRYDRDGNDRLDLEELKSLSRMITVYLQAKQTSEGVSPRKRVLDPLLNERAPSAEEMLKQYDADHDQKLNAVELSALAAQLRKN